MSGLVKASAQFPLHVVCQQRLVWTFSQNSVWLAQRVSVPERKRNSEGEGDSKREKDIQRGREIQRERFRERERDSKNREEKTKRRPSQSHIAVRDLAWEVIVLLLLHSLRLAKKLIKAVVKLSS